MRARSKAAVPQMLETSGTMGRQAHPERRRYADLKRAPRQAWRLNGRKGGVESVCGLRGDQFPVFPQEIFLKKKRNPCLQHVNPSAAAALKRKNRRQNLSHTHTHIRTTATGGSWEFQCLKMRSQSSNYYEIRRPSLILAEDETPKHHLFQNLSFRCVEASFRTKTMSICLIPAV